jgi:hypothetical protein
MTPGLRSGSRPHHGPGPLCARRPRMRPGAPVQISRQSPDAASGITSTDRTVPVPICRTAGMVSGSSARCAASSAMLTGNGQEHRIARVPKQEAKPRRKPASRTRGTPRQTGPSS